jgi:hypothetical protein
MKEYALTILKAMAVCAVHYRFVFKPSLDVQYKQLDYLKNLNKKHNGR